VVRAGGLGRLIGDEGSGYHIGMKAVRRALEFEGGWGASTSLLARLGLHFGIEADQRLSRLIQPIHLGDIKPHEVASLAEVVFEEAARGDQVAREIVDEAAGDLGALVSNTCRLLGTTRCWVYVVGGVFKQDDLERFYSEMIERSPLRNAPPVDRPLFVNLARTNGLLLAVSEALHRQRREETGQGRGIAAVPSRLLDSLPVLPEGGDLAEFLTKFSAKNMSTEEYHPMTTNLSQVLNDQSTRLEGLQIMDKADSSVLAGGAEFARKYLEEAASAVLASRNAGGRVFLVGSGSSGRVAADIAARHAAKYPGKPASVVGIIAGGARAFLRAKEGCEDSVELGKQAVEDHHPTSHDCVFLISASGSARFNIGAGKAGISHGCRVFYVHNSPQGPESELGRLLATGKVTSLLVDLGAQTITGSTRLQAASFALLVFGLLFNRVMELRGEFGALGAASFLESLGQAYERVGGALPAVEKTIEAGAAVFGSPDANFHRAKDETRQGYLTYLAGPGCLREIMIDTAETAPTFSTNLPRSINERGQKEAEFRAYMAGIGSSGQDNSGAWQVLMGRELALEEREQTDDLAISLNAPGYGSYAERPRGRGNLTILVTKGSSGEGDVASLEQTFESTKAEGGQVVLLAVLLGNLADLLPVRDLSKRCDYCVVIEGVRDDPLGLVSSITLKKVLNLLSNGVMILMHKVVGNIMVDVSPANNKLIDRSIRIIQELLSRKKYMAVPTYEELFELVTRVFFLRKESLSQHGVSVPSTIRIILEMLEKGTAVREAIASLRT